MMRSLGEVGHMVRTAARGAGIPTGQADNLSCVARHLAGTGGDTGLVTAALTAPLDPVKVHWADTRVTLLSGAAVLTGPVVCDAFLMGLAQVSLHDPPDMPLIAAYLATAGIAVTWGGTVVTYKTRRPTAIQQGPVTIPEPDWAIWQQLASRTYVPETTASRSTGAGAAISDND